MRRINLNILALLLVLCVTAVVITSYWIDIAHDGDLWKKVIVAVEFGLLGACLSMSYTITSSPVTNKIPEQMMGFFITIIRLAIGATAALISLMLINSDLLKKILSSELTGSPYSYVIVAFIAGFSERWVVNVIDKVSSEQKGK